MKIHLKGEWETREVWLNGKRLDPRPSQRVWNRSPDGFNWGYGGSGPAQLALAILLNFLPANQAVDLHQDFKWQHVATLPQADFEKEIEFEIPSVQ